MDNYNLKYTVAYSNIVGDSFLLEILQKGDFTHSENELAGSVIYTKANVSDVFEAIRPTTLTINLEASTTNILEDFQTFNEFDFKVKFYRNNLQIFEGWINPDGWFQDWVNDKWEISMTAVDGLGTLKNLEFLDKGFEKITPLGDPVEVTYAPREINYLHAILKRLDYELPYTIADDINVDLGVPVDWVDVKKRIIDKNVFINDNGTWQDCETILRDILQKYNLTITQENIEGRLVWYISRVIYGTYPTGAKRNRQYNTTNNQIIFNLEIILEQFAFADGLPQLKTIFSEINTSAGLKFNAIHCNENQQITFNPALQDFRFQSTWKGVRNFFKGVFNTFTAIPPYPSGVNIIIPQYIQMEAKFSPQSNAPVFESYLVSQISDVDGINLEFDWWIDFTWFFDNPLQFQITDFRFVVQANTDNGTKYWNPNNETWESSSVFTKFEIPIPFDIEEENTVTGTTNVLIGNLPQSINPEYKIILFLPEMQALNSSFALVRVFDIRFTFFADRFGTGKVHDSTQPEVKSTFLNDPISVINTNEPNAYFQNNLYRLALPPEIATGLVPMNKWKAFDTPQYGDLLELTGRERIRVKAKPQRLFRGDIFGYIPYSSVIKYDGIAGNFVPLSYQYRTVENVIELECSQIFNEDVAINHEKKYIFENEKNVLIKEL